MQPYSRLPILSSLCFAALNSSLDVLSWCEVRRAWEIESAKFIFNDHKTADTKLTNKWRHHHRTACFKFHKFLFVQPREKQATRGEHFFFNFLIEIEFGSTIKPAKIVSPAYKAVVGVLLWNSFGLTDERWPVKTGKIFHIMIQTNFFYTRYAFNHDQTEKLDWDLFP